jgi:hypothetical protein
MRINILYSYYGIYYDQAVVASYCLRKMGIESDVYCPVQGQNKRAEMNHFVYPEADYYIILNQSQFNFGNIPQSAKKILWFTEQVDFESKNQHIKNKSSHFDALYNICDYIIIPNILVKNEVEAEGYEIHGAFGLAYDEILTQYKDQLDRNIDVYFCGGVNERRRKIMNNIKKVVSVENFNCYRSEYHKMLAKSKIALNIHSYSFDECSTNFALLRLVTTASEGALIVTEPFNETYPFVKDDMVICEASEIPQACNYYLSHEDERIQMANRAFFRIKNGYRMEDLLYNFIVRNIDENFERKNVEAKIPEVKL